MSKFIETTLLSPWREFLRDQVEEHRFTFAAPPDR